MPKKSGKLESIYRNFRFTVGIDEDGLVVISIPGVRIPGEPSRIWTEYGAPSIADGEIRARAVIDEVLEKDHGWDISADEMKRASK